MAHKFLPSKYALSFPSYRPRYHALPVSLSRRSHNPTKLSASLIIAFDLASLGFWRGLCRLDKSAVCLGLSPSWFFSLMLATELSHPHQHEPTHQTAKRDRHGGWGGWGYKFGRSSIEEVMREWGFVVGFWGWRHCIRVWTFLLRCLDKVLSLSSMLE